MTPQRKTPRAVAGLSLKLLRERTDPVRAKQAQRFFKEEFKCFGLTSPQARQLAEQIHQLVKDSWAVEDAITYCDLMIPNSFHESKALSILILEKYKNDYPKPLFMKIKSWLESGYLANWAAVDVLCPTCVGALLEKYPALVQHITTWAASPNRWVRRASIVSFIKLAKKPEYLDTIYQVASSHFGSTDDLIHKAAGWLLREAGKTDPGRLEKFLLGKGPSVPRTTLRYAIERFDKKKRANLLLATRK